MDASASLSLIPGVRRILGAIELPSVNLPGGIAKGPSRMSVAGGRERKLAPEDGNVRSALWALFMGLLGLMTAFVVVAVTWNDESGVAALAAVASSIGAILTAYFGIQFSQRVGADAAATRRRRGR